MNNVKETIPSVPTEQLATSTASPPRKRRYGGPKRPLGEDFKPSIYHVICGRGSVSFDSDGNKRFRNIIKDFLPEYVSATGKLEKSFLVSKAVGLIQKDGAFVQQQKDGQWFEVADAYAREKVGAQLREFVNTQTKSSFETKEELHKPQKSGGEDSSHSTASAATTAPSDPSTLARSESGGSGMISIHDSTDHIPLFIKYIIPESKGEIESCARNDEDKADSNVFFNKKAAFHDFNGFHVIFADWSPKPKLSRNQT